MSRFRGGPGCSDDLALPRYALPCSNRRSGRLANDAGRTLMATERLSRVSRAR